MSQLYSPSGNTVSQIQIGNDSNKIYNIIDIFTRRTVADLCDQVNGIPTIKKLSTSASATLINATWKLDGEVYQIGRLVIGSFFLQDSKANERNNDQPYTLINGLPAPFTDIIFNCTTNTNKTTSLVLHSDGKLKWGKKNEDGGNRTTELLFLNIMYYSK